MFFMQIYSEGTLRTAKATAKTQNSMLTLTGFDPIALISSRDYYLPAPTFNHSLCSNLPIPEKLKFSCSIDALTLRSEQQLQDLHWWPQ